MKNEVVTFETYADMMSDYENGIENENYDDEIRLFTVSAEWANEWTQSNLSMDLEEFFEEYTWDDTYQMYDDALKEREVITDRIARR